MLPSSHLPKFIAISLSLHLGVVLCLKLAGDTPPPRTLEISFGTGKTAGGPAGSKKSAAPDLVRPKKISTAPKPKARPAPVVTKPEKDDVPVKPQVAETQTPPPIEGTDDGTATNQTGQGAGTTSGAGGGGYTAGAGAGIDDAMVKYQGTLQQLINRHKRYPPMARRMNHEGKVVVRLKLSRQGDLLDLAVVEPAPYESLTRASLEAVREIKKFPPIPEEAGLTEVTLNVPFNYRTVDGDFL